MIITLPRVAVRSELRVGQLPGLAPGPAPDARHHFLLHRRRWAGSSRGACVICYVIAATGRCSERRLSPDSQAIDQWTTWPAAGYLAAGVRVLIGGRGAHVLVMMPRSRTKKKPTVPPTPIRSGLVTRRGPSTRWHQAVGVLFDAARRWHMEDLAGLEHIVEDTGGEPWRC